MSITTLSSRTFNQDTSRAKKAADDGPVFITDRARPAYVLLNIAEYHRLSGGPGSLVEQLGLPEGIADIEFDVPRSRDLPRAADFD